MKRDFTYIDDIVEGVVRTLDHTALPNSSWSGDQPDPGTSAAPYRLYNIGNNNPVELMYLIEVMEKSLGASCREEICCRFNRGMSPATYADVEALVEDVGF